MKSIFLPPKLKFNQESYVRYVREALLPAEVEAYRDVERTELMVIRKQLKPSRKGWTCAGLGLFLISLLSLFGCEERRCIRSHQQCTTIFISSGGVMIPIHNCYPVCDEHAPEDAGNRD